MSDELEACASGCTVEWDGITHYRQADIGHYCHGCATRIQARLAEAPRILAVLRASLAGIRAVDTTNQRVDGTRDQRLPFNEHTLELADDLYAGICNWAISHAQTMGVTGSLPAGLSRLAEVEKDARSVPAVSSPREAAQRLREIVEWLTKWGDTIAHTIPAPSLADYHADIVDMIRKARGAAGLTEPRPRRASKRPCWVCGDQEVEASIPDVGPEVVRCAACHTVFDSSEARFERKAA